MRQLYIPEIGDEIRLTMDWTFDLYNEYRNDSLMKFIGDPRDSSYSIIDSRPCTIPTGEVLKVDRVYIRKGQGDFSSLTFLWKGMRVEGRTEDKTAYSITVDTLNPILPPGHMRPAKRIPYTYKVKIPAKPVRFWAKLADVNNIEFEPI